MKCTLTLLAGILLAPLGVADTVAPTKPSILLFLVDESPGRIAAGATSRRHPGEADQGPCYAAMQSHTRRRSRAHRGHG